MEYRIVEQPAFSLAGFRTRVPVVHLGHNSVIEEFEAGIDPAAKQMLLTLSDMEPSGTLAVTSHLDGPPETAEEVDYWHAVATTQIPNPQFEFEEVPAGTWVVLSTTGKPPEALQQLWAEAATEWFPNHPYRWAQGPQMLRVDYGADGTDDGGDNGDSEVSGQLWIPIEAEN